MRSLLCLPASPARPYRVALAASRAALSNMIGKRLAVRAVVASSFVFAFALVPGAQAAKSGSGGTGKQASAAPLTLVSQYTWLNPNDPPWCRSEDDIDQRTWSGSLNGSFAASEYLCNPIVDYYNGIWWDAGGIGLQSDVYVVGTFNDLTITSPLGDSHHAVLVGSSTSKGVTTNHYEACYVPSYSLINDIGGTPLVGGTWKITLSGNIANANWNATETMTGVTFQQQNCPVSQQNLVAL